MFKLNPEQFVTISNEICQYQSTSNIIFKCRYNIAIWKLFDPLINQLMSHARLNGQYFNTKTELAFMNS